MKRNRNEEFAYNRGYRISRDGNVIGIDGKSVNVAYNSKKYYRFRLTRDHKRIDITVHRLQAYQKFKDEIFREDLEVRHFDGNKINNSEDNILLGTHSQNMLDIPMKIRIEKSSKANKKYDDSFIIKVKEFYDNTKSYQQCLDKFGLSSKGTLHYLLKKKIT